MYYVVMTNGNDPLSGSCGKIHSSKMEALKEAKHRASAVPSGKFAILKLITRVQSNPEPFLITELDD